MAKHVIWKFEFNPPKHANDPFVSMEMPVGAKVLTLQLQGDQPQIWAEVDPNAHMTTRRFMVVATGQAFEPKPSAQYLGTFQIPLEPADLLGARPSEMLRAGKHRLGFSMVFHVFEVL